MFLQLTLIVGFVIVAFGSSSTENLSTSDTVDIIKSTVSVLGEADIERRAGRRYLGQTDSESECLELAKKNNCTVSYAWYRETCSCYGK